MKSSSWRALAPAFGALLGLAGATRAEEFSNGLAFAVEFKSPPRIDGDLREWNTLAAEPVFVAPQTFAARHAEWNLAFDDEAFYLAARVRLPNRALFNPSNPQDAFWSGDLLQLRVAADPALPFPLDASRDAKNPAVCHISLWKNTESGRDFLHINRGTRFDLGQTANPPGSQIAIVAQGTTAYTVEARVPWSALNAPGGRNPFRPGQKMALVLETLWIGGDSARVAAVYRRNPGTFAFNSPDSWGQVEFLAVPPAKRLRPSIEELAARFAAGSTKSAPVGVPFVVQVPADGLKTTVNILGPNGEVLRELIGGETHPKGPLTLRFDGRDGWGKPLAPGTYRWGALFHRGLKARWMGAVGKSGDPPYETQDGRGGWGADHSDPIDCAADESGLYFLWPVAEGGKAVVKTDYDGRVLWRKTPFVGGGFGPHFALASDGQHVFLTLGHDNPRLVRLSAATGALQTWGENGPSELPLEDGEESKNGASRSRAMWPASQTPLPEPLGAHGASGETTPDVARPQVAHPPAPGVAARNGRAWVSLYERDLVRVVDAQTGKRAFDLPCPGPRGLNFDANGRLLVVSAPKGGPFRVLRFEAREGSSATTVVAEGLVAPWDVAAPSDGRLFVSDNGAAQQIIQFSAQGRFLRAWGRKGGRPWMGAYRAPKTIAQAAFLKPAGLATDARGGLLVVESAIPKIISRFDLKSGTLKRQWFGSPVYWNATWPALDDPRTVFYQINGGIARQPLPRNGKAQGPNAYWALRHAGFAEESDFEAEMPQPFWAKLPNGRTYLVSDADPHTVALAQGDALRPVAHFRTFHPEKSGDDRHKTLEVWADRNGDARMQANEVQTLKFVNGKRLPGLGYKTGSMHLETNGDAILTTEGNAVLLIPAAKVGKNGLLAWNVAKARWAVPQIVASKGDYMGTTWRHGLLGARRARNGDFFAIFNTEVPGANGPQDYASPQEAARRKEGMGHTATFNAVKFARYAPDGSLKWMAGRKALGAAKPGEIYHFWNLAGLVETPRASYIAGGSEWGQLHIYTGDGFFVDSLMENPGQSPAPGPYTFGGETAGGRLCYFPDRDELWAYVVGSAFRVDGFKKGRVEGETRVYGQLQLDAATLRNAQTEPSDASGAPLPNAPLALTALTGDPLRNPALWKDVRAATVTKDGATLANAQLGYDADFVYGRFEVNDATPLQNGADTVETAFKGGDTVGVVLGAPLDAASSAPGEVRLGDVRLMIAKVGDRARVIAMKPFARREKQPQRYFTPATGEARFEWVGDVPGARVEATPRADGSGYIATFAVPRAFLEFEISPGQALRGDVEVRGSGQGTRGLQATSRNYLFTPRTPPTTMTDDLPTEARLYPEGWGRVEVR